VAHPSKYAVTRTGYLRGADLANTNKADRFKAGGGDIDTKPGRKPSVGGVGVVAGMVALLLCFITP